MDRILSVNNLKVAYNSQIALKGVDIKISEKEIVAIIGPNGAGKTTLLETIMGFNKPIDGEVLFINKNINTLTVFARRKLGIVLVPQEENIFPKMSVKKNLDTFSIMNKKHETEELMNYIYKIFPILKERSNQKAGTLSGGQQKMLCISMGLISNANVLLIDEPSTGLAPKLVTQVLESLNEINKEMNKTILLSEQNVKVLHVADKIYGLSAGEIEFCEETKNLSKDDLKNIYLG